MKKVFNVVGLITIMGGLMLFNQPVEVIANKPEYHSSVGVMEFIDSIPVSEPEIEVPIPVESEIVPVWDFTDDQIKYLKRLIQAECGFNQPDDGVRAATDVVLNRISSDRFPNTLEEVIEQPYHFSVYWNGMIDQPIISEQVNRIVDEEIMNGAVYPDIVFFCAGSYSKYCVPYKKIGDHYFGY